MDSRDILKASGRKATLPRLAVLKALGSAKRPMSPAAIHARLKKEANQATVYRTLEALARDGLLRRVDLGHRHAHYELAGSDHHHLVCVKCGRVEDFTGCGADVLARRALAQNRNFKKVLRHSIELFGVCRACGK